MVKVFSRFFAFIDFFPLKRKRMYRESCAFVNGTFVKDLRVIDYDLSRVCIIDNSPQAYSLQTENGIPISSWFEDKSDTSLRDLLPFLKTLACCQDVRHEIEKTFAKMRPF